MQRLSKKYLAALVLVTLTPLSIHLAHAQQSIAADPTPLAVAPSQTPPTTEVSASTDPAPTPAASIDASTSLAPPTDVQAPQPQTATQPQAEATYGHQTRRILGIIPNFRSVNADVKLPPQSVKDKFVTTTQDSFDYSSIVVPAFIALESLERNSTPEFGKGGLGYGRYLWHAAVDQTSENYFVEFIYPVVTHEDSRYYTLGHGGFVKRASYSLSRAVITRSDSGKEVFNISEVFGAGSSAGLSALYYPKSERNITNVGEDWGLDVGIDAATFFFKEFWPDINDRLFRSNRHSGLSAAAPAQP